MKILKNAPSKETISNPLHAVLKDKLNLTEKEAAAHISMSRSWLRHARIDGNREGRTPAPKFIKIGRSIRYPREELERWLAQFPRLSHLCDDGGCHVTSK